MSTSYAVAKIVKRHLETAMSEAAARMNAFPKGPMNLTPDAVKATKEYQDAKRESERAFAALRNFNAMFVRDFAKEYAADCHTRRGA